MLNEKQIKQQLVKLEHLSKTRLLNMGGRARCHEAALMLAAIVEHKMTEPVLRAVVVKLRSTMRTKGLPDAQRIKLQETIDVYEVVLNDGKTPQVKP